MDIAMFVGRQFYPEFWDYLEEAVKLGCCKKVPSLPKDIEVGESRVYLLHKEEDVRIFGYYTLDGIIKCALEQQVYDETWNDAGGKGLVIPAIKEEMRRRIPQRGCGGIDPPSYYLVGPDDITARLGYRHSPNGEDSHRIHFISDLVRSGVKYFRGYKYINDLYAFLDGEGEF